MIRLIRKVAFIAILLSSLIISNTLLFAEDEGNTDPIAEAMQIFLIDDDEDSITQTITNGNDPAGDGGTFVMKGMELVKENIQLPDFLELTGIDPVGPVDIKAGESRAFTIRFKAKPNTPDRSRGIVRFKFNVNQDDDSFICPDPTEWEMIPVVLARDTVKPSQTAPSLKPPTVYGLNPLQPWKICCVHGETVPNNLVGLFDNGHLIDMDFADRDGHFRFDQELPAEENELKVAVSNEENEGCAVSAPQTVEVDLKPPTITCQNPPEGIRKEAYLPEINIEDKNFSEVHYFINGRPWSPGQTIRADGFYTWKAWALDQAGNTAEQYIDFLIDQTPPAIRIKNAANAHYYSHPVTPTVTINDLTKTDTEITLDFEVLHTFDPGKDTLPYQKTTIYQALAETPEVYNLPKIDKEGPHTLTVTTYDQADRSSEVTIHFILDYHPPQVTIRGLQNNGVYLKSVTPEIKVVDPNLLTTVLTLNGKPYQSGRTIKVKGQYTLCIFAKDKAGNTTRKKVMFRVG